MTNRHLDNCSSALCKDMSVQEQEEVVWLPGERICRGVPRTLFQKEQKRINHLYRKGSKKYNNPNLTFTANELETVRQKRSQIARRRNNTLFLRAVSERNPK